MIESLLLTTAIVATFDGARPLSRASGFFFDRDGQLFFVTSRHVLIDQPSAHQPDRIEIELHTDAQDLTQSTMLSVLLYFNGKGIWRQANDTAGQVDVAVIALERTALPATAIFQCFTPSHLLRTLQEVDVGSAVLVVGYPLGFQDALHHLPVVRHAVIASSFGVRFQGQGYFLTDARTHRGISGAPVVMRDAQDTTQPLPWKLLGVHSSRLDAPHDQQLDETLSLNCAWYADILITLTNTTSNAIATTIPMPVPVPAPLPSLMTTAKESQTRCSPAG